MGLSLSSSYRCSDYLKFYLDLESAEINERFSESYELCGKGGGGAGGGEGETGGGGGRAGSMKHYSSTGSLVLEFHSDHIQTNSSGFKGLYTFLPKCKSQRL